MFIGEVVIVRALGAVEQKLQENIARFKLDVGHLIMVAYMCPLPNS